MSLVASKRPSAIPDSSDHLQVRGKGRRQSEDAVARLGHPELGQAAKEGLAWLTRASKIPKSLWGSGALIW